tara:strand:+ start:176 stop:466 length:291 start_codon:yes stop_codon:yes gene_type:complete
MKNTLIIDMDTDREDIIRLSKPKSIAEEVDNSETARLMVLDDLTTVCNALGTLINLADANKYIDSKTSSKMCIDFLTENFVNKVTTDEIKPIEDDE